jgi:excinuclease ABC subunit A
MHGCPSCGRWFEPLTPRHYSFNHPKGWCQACYGLGTEKGIDPEAVVGDESLSIRQGAITLWGPLPDDSPWTRLVEAFARAHGFTLDTPIKELSEEQRRALLYGSEEEVRLGNGRTKAWHGMLTLMDASGELGTEFRQRYSQALVDVPCSACGGGRLRAEAAAARLAGETIVSLVRKPIPQAYEFFRDLPLSRGDMRIAGDIVGEIRSRLKFLLDVGLDYLTLDRPGPSLSGGEAQRVRLAGQLGGNLTGLTYVMDEPTIGIHPRDNEKMLRVIQHLRDQGNTVVVVEHDLQTLRRADNVIDFGPGAGPAGGRVVATGPPHRLRRWRQSLTARYLSGELAVPIPERRRVRADWEKRMGEDDGAWLVLEGCRQHNLRDITVHFPLNCLVCVTGPSGSGKSTLVQDILYPALAWRLGSRDVSPGRHRALRGWETLRAVSLLDQSPIGRSPRSNPATYVGIFDGIREFFASLPEARMRGFTPGHFSFNRRGGRCEECEGMGARLVQMHFLPDVWVACEECRGKRYKPEVLGVRYQGRNISDVLEMAVGEAAELFANFPALARPLRLLCDMGLDYLPLGQAAPSLSGGEAQRMKIARELLRGRYGSTLYLLDEPTTGLHPADILKLVRMLNRLVDEGNTVVVIEHNMDLAKNADWIIDLGPGGGDAGGWLMAEGPPEMVAESSDSPTARYLGRALRGSPVVPRDSLVLSASGRR